MFLLYITVLLPVSVIKDDSKIYVHFGIDSVENLLLIGEIALLTDVVKQTINMLSMLNVVLSCFVCFAVFLLRLFNFCLLYLFIYLLLPYKMVK